MLRRTLGLLVLLCLGLLVGGAQGQGKDKKDPKKEKKERKDGIKATVVKVNIDKHTLTVEIGEKKTPKTFNVIRSVVFSGPKGGKSTAWMRDDRLVPGAAVVLYVKDGELTEVQLPFRPRKKAKEKEKDKK